MHPKKAPGPDGMASLFFIKYWDIIGHVVTEALNSGIIPPELNHPFITLISKKKIPEFVAKFGPISLRNILYKLVAKVLANRLKSILPSTISPTQCAFVLRRLIFDNVLVAYEIMYFLHHKRKGKERFMFLKLDISKAYHRVEWSFLEQVMTKMGFGVEWILKIMGCVTSVAFAILINSEPSNTIRPSWGLREGDSLSSYLFLLCIESLISLLSKACDSNLITGVKICQCAPNISYLLFADDSVLFYKANMEANKKIMSILEEYELSFGATNQQSEDLHEFQQECAR